MAKKVAKKVLVEHEESVVRDVPVTVKAERHVPYVKGRMLGGKELATAHWSGNSLVVTDVHNVSYTLTNKELEDFLG